MQTVKNGVPLSSLPWTVAAYIASEQARDLDAQLRLFCDDARVHDEGHDYRSLEEIRAWKQDVWAKFNYTIEVLNISMQDGRPTVKVRLVGDFPGGQVDLDFSLTFKGECISSLVIS